MCESFGRRLGEETSSTKGKPFSVRLRSKVRNLTSSESTDFIDCVNQFWTSNRMSPNYLPLHRGTFQSAIRLSDQRIVTLDSAFHLIEAFSHLDDWYISTLRHDYADVYGFHMS
jgi:hypothetical protein